MPRRTDHKPTPLVEKPQRLGVLPTMSFWRDPDHWHHVKAGMLATALAIDIVMLSGAVAATVVLGKGFVWGVAAYLLSAPLAIAVGTGLTLGLLERHIRRRALARREQRRMLSPKR